MKSIALKVLILPIEHTNKSKYFYSKSESGREWASLIQNDISLIPELIIT